MRLVLAEKRRLEAEAAKEERWNHRIAWINATIWNAAGKTLAKGRHIKPEDLLDKKGAGSVLTKEEEDEAWAAHRARLKREKAIIAQRHAAAATRN